MQAIWSSIQSAAISAWNLISSGISSAIESAASAVSSTVTGIYNTIVSGFNNAVSFVTGLGTTFYNAGAGLIEQMISGIKSMVGGVTKAIENIAGKARDYLPFSPAKTGPLSDLDKLDFGGPIQDSIKSALPSVQTSMTHMLGGNTAPTANTSYRPSIAPTASTISRNNSTVNNNPQITIQITGSSNPQETANSVRDVLDEYFASMGRVSPRTTEV
ncbi:hypothetical protein OVA29_08740 [Exiguobacterium sp. SL14]|nr:hypothetical protein [Exiguobacterium sp. SL14]MCY1690742.1 hypothetical protein [Exiguobacterium sp. SL14]